jgi:hypothetical protein
MAHFNALLQHQGPLKHASHAHRLATKPAVAPTAGFSMDDDGVVYGGMPLNFPPERTPEEQRDVLERSLEIANQEVAFILATGQAYEALNKRYSEIAAHNGGQMSDQVGDRFGYHIREVQRLHGMLQPAYMAKAAAEAKLSRMIHGLPQ